MANLRSFALAFVSATVLAGCGGAGPGGDRTPAARWTITAGPATYSTPDSVVQLDVPAGAVSDTTNVNVERVSAVVSPPAGMTPVWGGVWSFTHVTFGTPATLTLSYRSLLAGSGATPSLYRRSEGSIEWVPIPATANPAMKTISAPVHSFTSYGLFVPAGG